MSNTNTNKKQIKDKEYKVIILGPGGVGKSSITTQFLTQTFSASYNPTIEDQFQKEITVEHPVTNENKNVKLNIIDTAGQEVCHNFWSFFQHIQTFFGKEYRTVHDNYMRIGDAFILVYSVTDVSSLRELTESWILQLQNARENDFHRIPITVVGNKIDLERMITKDTAMRDVQTAIERNDYLVFLETSAKEGMNIDLVFQQTAKMILKKRHSEDTASNPRGRTSPIPSGTNGNTTTTTKKKKIWNPFQSFSEDDQS